MAMLVECRTTLEGLNIFSRSNFTSCLQDLKPDGFNFPGESWKESALSCGSDCDAVRSSALGV